MKEIQQLYKQLKTKHPNLLTQDDSKKIQQLAPHLTEEKLIRAMRIADIVVSEIGLGRTAVISVMLANEATEYGLSESRIKEVFDASVSTVIRGLCRVEELYRRNMSLETENFRKLLLSFAEDVRVILFMLAVRL